MAHLIEDANKPAVHDWLVRVKGESTSLRLRGVRLAGSSQLGDNPILFLNADGEVVFRAEREAIAYARRADDGDH